MMFLRYKSRIKTALLVSLLVAITCYMVAGPVGEALSEEPSIGAPAPIMVAQADVSPIVDPNDPMSVIYLDTSGKPAGTGDAAEPVSESFKAGQAWHPQALSAAGLPKDRYGLVDWQALVDQEMIAPKHNVDSSANEMPVLEMDVIIVSKGDFTSNVTFPHKSHTYWLNCEVCHPTMFVPAKGQNNMTMIGIVEGEWCGKCHGKVAFPLTDCNRCHNVPRAQQ